MLHLFGLIAFETIAACLTFGFERAGFTNAASNTRLRRGRLQEAGATPEKRETVEPH